METPRIVPLSSTALRTLKQLPRTKDRVFAVTPNALWLAWERLRRRAASPSFAFTIRAMKR
jgi:uroporphyrinogen-III synthase